MKKQFLTVGLFTGLLWFSGCNNDSDKTSHTQIQPIIDAQHKVLTQEIVPLVNKV